MPSASGPTTRITSGSCTAAPTRWRTTRKGSTSSPPIVAPARRRCSSSISRALWCGRGAGPATGYDWPASNHGIFVDHIGNVWIGGNGPGDSHVVKFTRDGKFLAQYGKPNARQSGKNAQGQPTFTRGSNDPGQLRPRREDFRRPESERSVSRGRLLQSPRRGARRGDGKDEAVLGRLRRQAR